MNTLLKVSASFIIGTALGTAIGYFTAPRKGSKSREQALDKFDATKKALEQAATSKLEEAKMLLNTTVKEQTKNAKDVMDKVKNAASMS